jgi:hypothetical protein
MHVPETRYVAPHLREEASGHFCIGRVAQCQHQAQIGPAFRLLVVTLPGQRCRLLQVVDCPVEVPLIATLSTQYQMRPRTYAYRHRGYQAPLRDSARFVCLAQSLEQIGSGNLDFGIEWA